MGCVLLSVTYGKKGNKIWSEIPKFSCGMAPTKLRIDVCGNTCIYIRYALVTIAIFTSMIAIELFYLTQLRTFLDFYLSTYFSLSLTGLSYIFDKV